MTINYHKMINKKMNNYANNSIKVKPFYIKVKSKNVTKFYKHGNTTWYKEIQYYPNTKIIKQITEIGQFNPFHDLSGFCFINDKMITFVNKRIKNFYPNGKIKSIETMGGEPNTNNCDILCGKQYYYRENGTYEKILNYHYSKQSTENTYNASTSSGLHGLQKYFNENNKIESIENYHLGIKHGWQHFYDKNGKLIEKQIFYSGEMSNKFNM